MNTALCCIAKSENNYIREWVEYHLNLGFSKIFIYDNNDIFGEIFNDVLADYIETSKVSIIDCRSKSDYQLIAYSDFYSSFGKEYDWIAYLDVDEFITFSEQSIYNSISNFLVSITDFNLIHINWMCFGDNDIVSLKTYKVLDRFTKPLNFNIKVEYEFPENNHIKSIVKGGRNDIYWTDPHTPKGNFRICNSDGIELFENLPFHAYSFKTIYIRHFYTKTINEWIQKINRGCADGNCLYPVGKFFNYNIKSKEKQDIIKLYLSIVNGYNGSYNELDDRYSSIEIIEHLQKQISKLNYESERIKYTKAYKIGKIILNPASFLKRKKNKK